VWHCAKSCSVELCRCSVGKYAEECNDSVSGRGRVIESKYIYRDNAGDGKHTSQIIIKEADRTVRTAEKFVCRAVQ